MANLKDVGKSVVTFPLFVLGGLVILLVWSVLFGILWFVSRDVADVLGLQHGGLFRVVVEYGIPGTVAWWMVEKLYKKVFDAIDRHRKPWTS